MTTIRRYLTRTLIAVVAVLLTTGGAAVFWSTRTALVRQFDATLRAKAMAITALTEQDHGQTVVEVSERLMREFDEHGGTDFFQLWDATGTTVAQSESPAAFVIANGTGRRQPRRGHRHTVGTPRMEPVAVGWHAGSSNRLLVSTALDTRGPG